MFRVYYHIPSRIKFLAFEKSVSMESLGHVEKPISWLKWKKDKVFIYDELSKKKTSIALFDKGDLIVEIFSASGIYSRVITKLELIDFLKNVRDVIGSPEVYGFVGESV